MKRIFLGPQGPPSYIGKWTENGLRMIERWINTLVEFRGATAERDGADGLVPQPKAGDEDKVLFGDGHWRNPLSTSGGTPPPPGSIPIFDIDGNPVVDSDFRYDPTTDTLYAPHIVSQSLVTDTVVADSVTVDPEPYGPGWDNDNSVPTKNDTYDAIQALAGVVAGVSTVPIFFTMPPTPLAPTAGSGLEYQVISGSPGVVVDPATRLIWIMATITGSAYIRKKVKKSGAWTFDLQLKKGSAYYSLGKVSVGVPSNGKWTPFSLPLTGSVSRVPAGTYSLVLISSTVGQISPGALTVNAMGQMPK